MPAVRGATTHAPGPYEPEPRPAVGPCFPRRLLLVEAVADEIRRLGRGLPATAPSVWVHTADVASIEPVLPALWELRRTAPRYRLVLTSHRARTRRQLRDLWPDAEVQAPPLAFGPLRRRWLHRIDPRALMAVESTRGIGAGVLESLGRRGCPVLVVVRKEDEWAGDLPAPVSNARWVDLRAGPPAVLDAIVSALRAPPEASGPPEVALGSLTGLGRVAVRRLPALVERRVDAITDLTELYEWLGRPARLLCLGNGPSSRTPELAGLVFDCLFRVNWRWLGDRHLVRPDMVFTGDASGLGRVDPCILGVRTPAEETHILAQRMLRPRPWRIRYAALARLPLALHQRAWRARPTNGAAMIATAAALQPACLVVAGMDLFEHPAGAYPDDRGFPNAYLAMHDRDVEIAIIRRALAAFRGETVILSPTLRARLARPGPTGS